MSTTSLPTTKDRLSASYDLLPFRFKRFPLKKMLLVNEAGEYLFLTSNDFDNLLGYKLDHNSHLYRDLKAKHFLYDSSSKLVSVIEMLSTKYRTKKAYLNNFTALHMVVTTLRCNHRCSYCHASSQEASAKKWDMSIDVARKVVDMIFQSPSPVIKIEFQGGEPLLNFPVVKEIVQCAKRVNRSKQKHLSFVLCTNLTLIDKDILNFLREHGVLISTSLDGPKNIHNANRIMRSGESSYDMFMERLELARSILGHDKISALMTITKSNIDDLNVVIDEYIRLGFNGIFLRSLNPYGYAKKESGKSLQYHIEDFITSYKKAMEYIITLNNQGTTFVEYFAAILLSRILTPFSTGFMDLQSPAGAGILGAIYNYDGEVYPTDEARMLAAAGDTHFQLGSVSNNTHKEIFGNDLLKKIIRNSCVETIPGCHGCAYQMYCGADPIRAYSQQNDKTYVGHMPSSEFCRKHREIISFLLEMIAKDDEVLDIFWSWITKRNLKEVRI